MKVSGVRHNATIIPHIGYAFGSKQSENDPPRLFTLVHAGKLGALEAPGRPARPLLVALKQFLVDNAEARSVTRLTLVGPEDEGTGMLVRELGLEAVVENTGRVSYEESLKYIKSAAVCLLVEAVVGEGIFLPSKLADYLAAGKPVLALSPRDGTVADMPAESGVLRVDAESRESAQTAIATLYEYFKASNLRSRAPVLEFANQFTPRAVAARFLAAANSICSRAAVATKGAELIWTGEVPPV